MLLGLFLNCEFTIENSGDEIIHFDNLFEAGFFIVLEFIAIQIYPIVKIVMLFLKTYF